MDRVRSGGWGSLTQQELDAYLGKPATTGQNDVLAQNFMWGEGYNPQDVGQGGTPAYNYLAGLVPGMYNLASFDTAITGKSNAGLPALPGLEEAQRAMRAGQSSFYTDRGAIRDRLGQLDALIARGGDTGGDRKGFTADELGLMDKYGGEGGMDDLDQLVGAAYGGTLNPFMRGHFTNALKGLRRKYMQQGTSGGRYSKFLVDMLAGGAV